MKFTPRQVVMLIGGVVLVVIIGVAVFLSRRPTANNATAVKLSVWGVESKDVMSGLFSQYPYATVTYTQIDPSQYDAQLLSALAAGRGPDVFEINDHSLPRWENVLAPLPAAYATEFGAQQLAADFPDVVGEDFVSNGQIYALPLSVDTLAMFYNKDLFNNAGIVFPPKTWDDFEADILKLRTVDAQGNVTQAAASIGGSETSIANASDLVFLLMLQNGTKMVASDLSSAQFANSPDGPGIAAFNFYLQFANAGSQYYTWNDALGNAVDNFASGKSAIFFGYASDLATIKAKAPFLNIGVAPMPQPTGATLAVNYPRYYGFAAAKVSPQLATAWNLILYMTTSASIEEQYVAQLNAPPALRTEIQANISSSSLSVFAAQALTAKSWYEADDQKIDAAMNSAVVSVANGAADSWHALQVAQGAVDSLMSVKQ